MKKAMLEMAGCIIGGCVLTAIFHKWPVESVTVVMLMGFGAMVLTEIDIKRGR